MGTRTKTRVLLDCGHTVDLVNLPDLGHFIIKIADTCYCETCKEMHSIVDVSDSWEEPYPPLRFVQEVRPLRWIQPYLPGFEPVPVPQQMSFFGDPDWDSSLPLED